MQVKQNSTRGCAARPARRAGSGGGQRVCASLMVCQPHRLEAMLFERHLFRLRLFVPEPIG